MKFLDFLDLIISGAFALGAFLFYLIHKDNLKVVEEKWGLDKTNRIFLKVKAFLVIFLLMIFSIGYFFSFIKSFSF
jgi:hypothetical protein